MSRNFAECAALVGIAASIAFGVSIAVAEQPTTAIEFAKNGIGVQPTDFEFQRTGEGELGRWAVVRDPTAVGGFALEHVSTDQHDDRFPLAVYRPLSLENVEVSVHFKIVSGTMQTAGMAIGVRTPSDYYAVSASALEQRVALLLFVKGKSERIESAEADVVLNRWHTLTVTANDDHIKVLLDQKILFTTYDRTRRKDGRIALWTQEDNVTRFDHIEIHALPPTEWR